MRLEIEHLVVHGVSGSDSQRLVAVIERELRSLVSARGAAALGSLDLPGDVFEIPAGLGVDDVGRRVAESIWNTCQDKGGTVSETGPIPVSNDTTTSPPDSGGRRGRE